MTISGQQRQDTAIYTHVSILPQTPLPSRPPHNTEQSSMYRTLGPCWLYILNIAVCICSSQTPQLYLSPLPLPPAAIISLESLLLSLNISKIVSAIFSQLFEKQLRSYSVFAERVLSSSVWNSPLKIHFPFLTLVVSTATEAKLVSDTWTWGRKLQNTQWCPCAF